MKDAFYFKHDLNARNDPKFARLIRQAGWQAYGIAWAIIEMLYEQHGRISHDPDQIAYELRADNAAVEAAISCPIFFVKDGMIGSERVDRALDDRREAQENGRKNAKKRWGANGGPMATHEIANTRRGEEKEKEKEKEITDAPSASDFSNHRLKIGGEFKDVHVSSLTVETAKRALDEGRPNRLDRAALEWWIAQKQAERGGKRGGGLHSAKDILGARS